MPAMRLAACDNPLRTELTECVPFHFRQGDWQSNLDWLEQLRFRAAIVGPKGSGKTTLLSQLASRLPDGHYVNLPHDHRWHSDLLQEALCPSKRSKILLIDGIERLTWWQREKLYFQTAARRGLVVVVHSPCRLPTWIRCETDETLMCAVMRELGLNRPEFLLAAKQAFRRHNGNIREALRLLYDQFASETLRLTNATS